MNIDEARKKFGKRAERMSDKDIEDLLIFLRRIVNRAIDDVVK